MFDHQLSSFNVFHFIHTIKKMDTSSIDRRLLLVFETLMACGSVSKTATAMGMSQPSVSYALSSLRTLTGDPLFVRVKNTMAPTPHAVALSAPIRRVLDIIEREIIGQPPFDPATSERTFTLCMTDIGEAHYMPTLMQHLCAHAPKVRLRVVSLTPERLEPALEEGGVDLAIGFFPDLNKSNFYQQQLSKSSFVCIARQGNPHVGRRLTLKRYLAAPHAAVAAQVRNLEVLDKRLSNLGIKERLHIAFRTPHFMALAQIVANTDLIANATLETARYATALSPVVIHSLPFDSPGFPLRQHWHLRYHRDDGNQWLRRLVYDLFRSR